MNNWPIYGADGIPVAVTNTSAATLVATDAARAAAEDVMIDNPGPLDVYVKAGGDAAVATLASVRVPAASLQPFRKGGATHLALISTGAQAVVVHVGAGQ